MIDSRGQTKSTLPVSAAIPNQELSLGHDSRAPALSSRPWFLSLLPSADVKRTEGSLNAAQRRVTGFIRFITGRPLSAKDVKTAADASQEHLAAAKASTVEEVKKRISSSADINRVDDRGMSATIYAAERGDIDTLKALVTAGSNINLVNGEGQDALLLAAKNGHAGIIEYLLAQGADITRVDRTGCTAFVLAARAGKTAVIQSFIDAGVNIDAPADNGCTPLMCAAEGGHVEFVEKLIANGADANKINMQHKMTAMMYAAQKGLTDVVKLLLLKKVNLDIKASEGSNALMLAARHGQTAVVELLLEHGASADEQSTTGCNALIITGHSLSTHNVETAVEASRTPLTPAKDGTLNVVKNHILSSSFINGVDDRGTSATMYAAERGDIDMLKALVTSGSNINLVNGEGQDALLLAAKNGHAGIIKYLLAQGADITRVDRTGCTAFVLAARAGKTAVIQSFINAGVNIDAPADNGCTPLMCAAEGGHVKFVEKLIANGANANKINMQHKMTAMMYAARKGLTAVVELLLEHGASADEESTTGQNALIFAAENGYDSTVISLIEGGANQDKALLAVLKYKTDIAIPIVRAWLNSKKNKFDELKAIKSCSLKTVTNFPDFKYFSVKALDALAEGGLTLTKGQLGKLNKTLHLNPKNLQPLKERFVDGHISKAGKVRNAYWSGNHAVVDAAINAPEKTKSNPLGLREKKGFAPDHITRDDGKYLHAVGKLRDQSRDLYLHSKMDSMLTKGWRSKITTLIRNARSEAKEATREISALLGRSDLGLTLTDQIGSTVPATNIRLKDTLFAAELERNEGLKQIIEPPVASLFDKLMAWAKGLREQTVKAQAEAILASNSTYIRLKLNMPALVRAKTIEKEVRTGHLNKVAAVAELDRLISETEHRYLEPPGITSELAYHWLLYEVCEVCETLKTMRDQFKEASSAVPA